MGKRDLDELVDFLFERLSSTRALIGSPESCQPLVRALAAAGVNEIKRDDLVKVTLAGDAHTTFDTPALEAVDIIAHHNATFDGSFADIRNAAEIAF